MARLTPWSWWAGHDEDGQCEVYQIDEQPTRDAVIRSALRECVAGERFHVIEARMWDRADPAADEFQPFARTRNHEVFTVGPHLTGDGRSPE